MKTVCVGLVVLIVGSCAVNPVTGKRELTLVSQSQQIQIGAQQYSPGQQSQGGVYYLDPQLNDYVNSVGQRLAAVSDTPTLPFEFVVLNNSVPNAWALPGGKIAINRGLLIELEDEAQLAAVLGHEVVHAAAGHGASQMSRGMLIGLGAGVASIATADKSYGNLVNIGSQLGAAAWMASYGRDDELESDQYGMEYMARVGYDPYAAVELQRTFVRLSEGRQSDFISGLFASHPPSQQRVDANLEHAQTLPAGVNNREEYQRAIGQLLEDQPAYEAQGKAEEALRDDNPQLAIEYLDQAVAIQPDEGQFWELRGHAWQMLNDTQKADQAFTTAIRKNDNFFQHWLSRGSLRLELGRSNDARTDLEQSYELLPTGYAALKLGDIAADRGATSEAVEYYRTAASGSGETAQEAGQKLARIELSSQPNNYVASGFYQTNSGNLVVAIRNDSPINVSDIQVVVTHSTSGASRSFSFRGPVSPGEQESITTNIQDTPANYRISVTAAQPY